ncbi:MAG: tetratricopeptide repeat protein, partial [Deltaproteobacteria bacterium]|nr:tetratricopeptide repeat protein [Deltaproteobacteria bacterium]
MKTKAALPKVLVIVAGFFLQSAVLPTIASARLAWKADPQLEAAIIKEDWSKVASLLDSDSALPPAARLVKAHAYLVLNRNNESLCLFLSVSSEDDLRQWEEWAQSFAKKNPRGAIAHYFRGDALARLRQWDAALKAFNKTLELHPNHPLALNA